MRSPPFRFTQALLLSLPLAGSGCSGDPSAVEQPIRLSARAVLGDVPLFIAEEEGFFRDEGLRLEYVDLTSDTWRSIPLLEQGKVDVIGGIVSVGIFNAAASGARVRIVADKGHVGPPGSCAHTAVVGRKQVFGAQPLTAANLRGKRIAADFKIANGYMFSRVLDSLGLSDSDVRLSVLPRSAKIQALENGAVDAVTMSEPQLTMLRDLGHPIIASANDYVPGQQQSVLMFGPSLLGENRATGVRFLRAYLRGTRQFSEGPTERNLDLTVRRTGLDRAQLSRMCWPLLRPDGRVDLADLEKFAQWAAADGSLERVASPAEFADTTLAADAARSLAAGTP